MIAGKTGGKNTVYRFDHVLLMVELKSYITKA